MFKAAYLSDDELRCLAIEAKELRGPE
jgi:hypothetical protein